MINFFRKIRQKLLTENKFSKYILYAIGEIALVVIGILIALQVNIWNETRKSQELFDSYISQLKVDVETAIKNANRSGEFSNMQSVRAQNIIDFLLNPESNVELKQYKEAIDLLGRYSSIEVSVGNLGELLSGKLDNVYRDQDLVIKVHALQGSLANNLEITQRMARRLEEYQAEIIKFRNQMYFLNYPTNNQDWIYDSDYWSNSPQFLLNTKNIADANSSYSTIIGWSVEELRVFKEYLDELYLIKE
ncbi:MAG: hypothetical protein HKP39_06400 [Eudoraea sp.]|nr:hypothetical protein [Eudoraea sp.]